MPQNTVVPVPISSLYFLTPYGLAPLGQDSGLVDLSQNMTAAAMQMAEKNV